MVERDVGCESGLTFSFYFCGGGENGHERGQSLSFPDSTFDALGSRNLAPFL